MFFDNFELSNFIYIKLDNTADVIRAIVEILCLTYIIYAVLNLVRETRAWQLLKGVLFIVVITAVANIIDLRTLAYIINNTFGVLAIGTLVVFQPELRRGLEQIGRSTLRMFPNAEDGPSTYNVINAITRACSEMSNSKTGALIVLERQTKLGEIINTGITLGAGVSAELLMNIFTKNTPLHDGAVVIRKGRIEAATCYLPLTGDSEIAKELGTRHRAAIGMTEVSDSLVIVVSEETGNISLIENGVIYRGLNEDSLRGLLAKGLSDYSASARKISLFKGKDKYNE